MTGFTLEQAQMRREKYKQVIHACSFCLNEGGKGPYYFAGELSFIGHKLACPDHYAARGP